MSALEKQQQIIFSKGKEHALESLFTSIFPYLALGYIDEDNGFTNSEEDFKEIDKTQHPTYKRVPISYSTSTSDIDTGVVSVEFIANIDIDNIEDDVNINQFAICDCAEGNTIFYAASTFPTYTKNGQMAITFVLEMTM